MKKLILKIGALFIAGVSSLGVISCSLFSDNGDGIKSKLEFYNYENYMNDHDQNSSDGTSINVINKYYHYTTFGDLPEFETYINQDRTVGGIGSDYFNTALAEKNLLRKIDFHKLFDINSDKSQWPEKLQKIYTPEAWGILSAFKLHKKNSADKYLDSKNKVVKLAKDATSDVDGDGVDDYLWEYMVPYFTQNKVVVFNPFSTNFDQKNPSVKNILQGNDYQLINKLFQNDLSYEGILKKLQSFSYGNKKLNFILNNYMRDNMMIGTEVINKIINPTNPKTNGLVLSKNEGINQLNAYKSMIDKYVDVTFTSTDGVESLKSLLRINNDNPKADVGFLYNGDALYGWKGGDITGAKHHEFRIVVPKNSTYLSDGLIMIKNTTKSLKEQERFYNAIKQGIYQGATTKYWKAQHEPFKGFKSKDNMLYQNYDFVAYTPAFENLHQMINDVTYGGGIYDNIGQSIANATRSATGTIVDWNYNVTHAPLNLDSFHLTQPISKNLTSELVDYNNAHIAVFN